MRTPCASDGTHVGGHAAEETQPSTTAEAEEVARRRTQGTLLDPRGDEDVGGRVAGTQLQRLVAVRRGQGAHGGLGAQHGYSLPVGPVRCRPLTPRVTRSVWAPSSLQTATVTPVRTS